LDKPVKVVLFSVMSMVISAIGRVESEARHIPPMKWVRYMADALRSFERISRDQAGGEGNG
jgi:hypothetical protein